ncbi:MAG: sulfate reduction electron transfer complex DsrMKJOP subunit DsrM [Candidatus Latescibacterota bacterium]|nr:MAG: sulfate reduction electron transfer complex DsrMKJOP subunit DsrM [Candidatus Latescibacterota bacterium]
MNALLALFGVAILFVIAYLGVDVLGLHSLFGIVLPYAAIFLFLIGFVVRIFQWAKSPVPFRITTTSGQQKSLNFIKSNNLESPHNTTGVIGRMALEILFFRSLFRNTKAEVKENERIVYGPDKWLWAAALAFHWSFLIVFLRHYRFFAEPVPEFILKMQAVDGLFQVGTPIVFLTGLILLASVTFLFLRRVVLPQVRYISLLADYFALFVIMAIAISGLLMRHFYKVDIVGVKELAMTLVGFKPVVPEGIGFIFYVHLFFVCVLFAYFPFSKLMHLGGVFLSPTRNLANTNRIKRHINPWNYEVKTHTYEEYEDEFRDVMREAGLPLEKES